MGVTVAAGRARGGDRMGRRHRSPRESGRANKRQHARLGIFRRLDPSQDANERLPARTAGRGRPYRPSSYAAQDIRRAGARCPSAIARAVDEPRWRRCRRRLPLRARQLLGDQLVEHGALRAEPELALEPRQANPRRRTYADVDEQRGRGPATSRAGWTRKRNHGHRLAPGHWCWCRHGKPRVGLAVEWRAGHR